VNGTGKDMSAMTRLGRLLAAGTAATFAAAGLAGCGASRHDAEPAAQPPVAVTTAPAAAVDLSERVEAGGIVAARESALISSRLVATIVGVAVRAGDQVRAGDVLVTLDARDVGASARQATAGALAAEQALAQARSAHAAAEADQRLATAWHTRIVTLHGRKAATDQERDEADARLAAATERVHGVRAGIEAAGASLTAAREAAGAAATTASFAVLRAPFAGVVTERLTDPGNLASPGVPLLRLEALGAREIRVRVDEARATQVRPGDRVQVIVDAGNEAAAPGAVLDGTVREVARTVAADPLAFTVTVALPASAAPPLGGFARVRFAGAPRRGLAVPASAIRRHGQVTSVFVARDGVARMRLVHVGPAGPDGVEVLAGLDAGEAVVVSPPARLQDGAPIRATAVRPGAAS
jgi:RND family efflux transporter MFP subunit